MKGQNCTIKRKTLKNCQIKLSNVLPFVKIKKEISKKQKN